MFWQWDTLKEGSDCCVEKRNKERESGGTRKTRKSGPWFRLKENLGKIEEEEKKNTQKKDFSLEFLEGHSNSD